MPLPLILVGAVWALGWTWWFLLLFPLSLLCTTFITTLRTFHQTSHIYKQISELYARHPNWRFTHITTAEYLEALYRNTLTPADEAGEIREQEFVKSMLTSSEYYGGEHLRMVVIETQNESGIGVLATFATMDRAWIFLDSPPSTMEGFEHFKVLHEVGHTDTAGILLGYTIKGHLTFFLPTLLVMALMLKWDTTTLMLVSLYWLVFLSLIKFTFKWCGQRMRFIEEVYADDFAVERCPRHWFDGFSDQDVKDFANAVCGSWSPGSSQQGHSSLVYDAPLTEQQVKWRRISLINRLNRLLKGDKYVAKDRIPMLSLRLVELLGFCQNVLLTVLALVLGFQHAELTTPRLIALVVLMMTIIMAGLVIWKTGQLFAIRWDANLNAKPISERTSSEQKDLANFEKGLQWREQFDSWWYQRQDRKLDNDTPAAGTTGRLFMPKEVDLYVDLETTTSYIFHGKTIDYDISHLEYVAGSHSIVVVKNNQLRLDLGIKLGSRIRPHFLKADKVQIIRTENGETVEGIVVPLSKG